MTRNKIYFASDFHLGYPNPTDSLKRERLIVKWLEEIKVDAEKLFLLGDIFDYWWEYKKVVPRGFTRFLGKLAEFTDNGIEVHFFTGNHDIWVFDYLSSETGLILHKKPYEIEFSGVKFFLAHGDGLGPGDLSYKFLKKIFENKILQWLFARLHPNFSISLAHKWSRHSRNLKEISSEWKGKDKEYTVLFAKDYIKKKEMDFFVFGHRHIPLEIEIGDKSRLVNLGDWIVNFSYAVFDGEKLELKYYKK